MILFFKQCHFTTQDSVYQQYQNTCKEYTTASNMLRNASRTLSSIETGVLEKIEDIAKTKFAFSVVASCIHEYNGMADRKIILTTDEKRLFNSVGKLCEECHLQWPRYIIMHLLILTKSHNTCMLSTYPCNLQKSNGNVIGFFRDCQFLFQSFVIMHDFQ